MAFLTDHRKDQLAWGMVLVCPGLFVSNMLVARGMSGVFPPMAMAFSRWLFVGLLITAALMMMRRLDGAVVRAEKLQLLFLASLGMGLCGGPVYLAGELTVATNIGLIYSAAPLLIALIAMVVLGEKLRLGQAAGLVMGLVGVVVIMTKADLGALARLEFNKGDLWVVVATFSFSVYSLGLKHFKTRLTQIQRFGMMALGGALWHAPFVVMEISTRGPWPSITIEILGALGVLIFLSSIGAYLSYGYIVSRLGTTVAGATLYLLPIYAAVLSMLILGEAILTHHWIGVALILPGLWLTSRRG